LKKKRPYNNGDILIATIAPPASGLLFHKGIVYNIEDENGFPVPHVFHNTPMKLNKYGGTVILETLEQFEADGREVVAVEPSGVDIQVIIKKNSVLKKRKFDWSDFNCEHYVTFVTEGRMKSIQMHKYVFITAVGVATFFFVRFIRKVNSK
jgi:hypothetical protein